MSFVEVFIEAISKGEWKGAGIYNIGFINDDEREDEVQFDVEDSVELLHLWEDFCKENGFDEHAAIYLEYVSGLERN